MTTGGGTAPEALLPLPVIAVFLLLAALVLHAGFGVQPGGFLATGALADTDSWTRSLRVLALWQDGGWFEETLPRLAPPDGLSLHWTRPLDILILLPAMGLHGLGGLPRAQAVLVAGGLLCPVLHWLAAVAAAWAARPLWPRLGPPMAGLLLLLAPPALSYAAPGRSDHHTLILLAGVLALGAALRALRDPADARAAGWAGAWLGFGLWVSVEGLLFAAPVLAGFGLAWVLEGHAGWPPGGMAGQGRRVALGMAAMAALGVVAEYPPAAWLSGAYDKVSEQHVAIALLAAVVFALAGRIRPGAVRRLVAGAVLGAGALGILLLLYPRALQASIAGADADAVAQFLPAVKEMQALGLGDAAARWNALFMLGPAPAGLSALVLAWPAWRRAGRSALPAMLGLVLLATAVATWRHQRFGADLAAPAALLAAGLPVLALAAPWPALPRVVAALGALGLAAGLPLLGGARLGAAATAAAEADPDAGRCGDPAIIAALARFRPAPERWSAEDPVLVANDTNAGPELAWRSGFRPVAGPYHRGGAAMADTYTVFGATEDGAARAVLARRGATWLLLCPGTPEPGQPRGPGTLAERLAQGAVPGWLDPVAVPDLPAGARLFRLRLP